MERIYLDNASTSFPKAEGVAEAVYQYIKECGCNINRGGYDEAYQAEELVLETRQRRKPASAAMMTSPAFGASRRP